MTTGAQLIGDTDRPAPDDRFQAIDAATGESFGAFFGEAANGDIADACAFADAAFGAYRALPADDRAAFIATIAARLDTSGDALIDIAARETGLPRARLEGERGRTVNQLRLFAATIRTPGWDRAVVDPADPTRIPPKPRLELRYIAIGPVAVFGASNFPLAFSVAGGDTASALAAGCPVVVKAHPAHPGTSEAVARIVRAAAHECGMPEGVFSLVTGRTTRVGQRLVQDARIAAVGFTGSRSGGLALAAAAAARAVPIPVFAEMSSINPQFLLPAALAARGDAIATGYATSLTLGVGQFCTNPGVVVAVAGRDLDRFVDVARDALTNTATGPMLTPRIAAAYAAGVADRSKLLEEEAAAKVAAPTLFEVDAARFLADPRLHEEIFGPAGLIVSCGSPTKMFEVATRIEGQLTASIHFDAGDSAHVDTLLPILECKAGRIVANDFPTGVEVSPAMVHGGPFPATTDSRFTAVGTRAIDRFLRPICLQNFA